MRRQIAVALVLACAANAASIAPAAAAFEFYVRIQGPKPAKPPLAHTLASLSFESDTATGSHTGGAGSGKVKYGEITVTKDLAAPNAVSAQIISSPGSANSVAAPAPLVHQTVTVACGGFNVQADFGKGPIKGVLSSQSVDGLCIYVVPMSAAAAETIVRVGLPNTPPGWSFNSQPQSKCVRSGETLDGTLSESQNIFSFMWSPARTTSALLAPGPCVKP